MIKLIFILVSFLCMLSINFFSELAKSQTKEDPVVIAAPSVNIYDDVQSYAEKVTLTQTPLAIDLNQNLQKLPGAIVTQFSGPGSQSAIIAPIATGSGGTLITIDNIPIVSPLGRATDLTYFPPAFFKRVDWYSPFYPWSEGRISPGGRLDLTSRNATHVDTTQVGGSVLYGTAQTAQVSTLVAKKSKHNEFVFGLTGFRTDGNYNFVDPRDGTQQQRQFNNNRYVGLLLKDEFKFSEKTAISLLAVSQAGFRTDPSRIIGTQSGVGHELFFGQFALKLTQKDLWFDDTEQSWLATNTVDRSYYSNFTTFVFGAGPPVSNPGQFGGENAQGNFFSWQIKGNKKRSSLLLQADGLYEKVETYYPLLTDRQVFGFTASYDAIKISEKDFIVPRARVEQISTFSNQTQPDGSLSYIHEFEPGKELYASVSLLHKTPSMIALFGYIEGGLAVSGLPTLAIERLEVYSLGYNMVEKNHGLWLNTWYSHHKNMALRSSSSTGAGLFTQINDAQTYGTSAQFTCQFLDKWGALISGSLEQTRNNDLGKELTFKPHYIVSSTLNYEVTKQVSLALEDTYEGTRYFSASNVSSFPNGSAEPINWTHLKSNIKLGPGSLYVKVSNIFDASGYDNPGYPYPGRSYWVGYNYFGDL